MGLTFFPLRHSSIERPLREQPRHLPRIEGYQLVLIVCLADLLAIAVPGIIGYSVTKQYYPQIVTAEYANLWGVITGISLLFFFGVFRCYGHLPLDFRSQLPLLITGFSLSILLVAFGLFSLKIGQDYSRGWFVGWWLTSVVALVGERVVAEAVRSHLVKQGSLAQKFAIYGAGDAARPIIEGLRREPGIEVVGIFDDRTSRVPIEMGGIPISGGVKQMAALAHAHRIDRVVIMLPLSAGERIAEIARALYSLPLHIDVGFGARQGDISFRRGDCIGNLLLLAIQERPLAEWRRVIKAGEDITLSGLLLLAILPLMAIIALAIKLDSPGPVLFRQKRVGFTGGVFEVLKFRTMFAASTDPLGTQLTQRGDPRITRVGRYLRRFSLDELPQIINVLRGEMSLVGPRPHPLAAKAANIPYQDSIDSYALRHRVKPGITGWAQVKGWRGETNTVLQLRKRVEHDVFYIEHWSLWMDLKILAITVWCVFNTKNVF